MAVIKDFFGEVTTMLVSRDGLATFRRKNHRPESLGITLHPNMKVLERRF